MGRGILTRVVVGNCYFYRNYAAAKSINYYYEKEEDGEEEERVMFVEKVMTA